MPFPILAAAIPAAAGLVGGILSNKAQADATAATNEMNARQAQLNREWLERLANTAHQREVADLRAAGMNPILTATGGSGASTPGAPSATMIAPEYKDPIGPAVSSAMQGAQMASALENTAADTAQKMEQAKLAASQNASTAKDVERKGIENAYTGLTLGQQIKKGDLDIKQKGFDVNMSEKAFVSKLKQAQNEALISSSKVQSARDAAKYDYDRERMLEQAGYHSTSLKDNDDDSMLTRFQKQIQRGAGMIFKRAGGAK